jgi:hypothetical protein
MVLYEALHVAAVEIAGSAPVEELAGETGSRLSPEGSETSSTSGKRPRPESMQRLDPTSAKSGLITKKARPAIRAPQAQEAISSNNLKDREKKADTVV